jgi:hypothetical protein
MKIIELLKRILYNNPNNKKFVVSNFSTKIEHFQLFEKEVCPINKVVSFCEKLEDPVLGKKKTVKACVDKATEVFNKIEESEEVGTN